MREFVILNSSTLSPPNPNPPPPRHHQSNPKPKPRRNSLLTNTTKPSILPPRQHSKISAVQFRPNLLSTVRWDHVSPTFDASRLKYYAHLASSLASSRKFEEFMMVVEGVIVSGIEARQFIQMLNVELVSKGICGEGGKVWSVVEFFKSLDKLGVDALQLFDKIALKAFFNECREIVKGGEVEEAVDLIESLAGLRFPIRELGKPIDVIKICVDKRKPELAVRYACVFPHSEMLYCTIVNEFGKKRDLRSALAAFEASKHNMSGPNMFAYRTMIDVCGLCGDYVKSRYIYEELLSLKAIPNIYVYNSLMNVNSHDLSYTLDIYKNMQNLGVTADMASFNILLKACCLTGRVDLAQDIYVEVQSLESKGIVRLDVFTYSTIIKVFADAKLWTMALRVKEDMISAGVTPNSITWSSLISACANAGRVEQAIELFEEMILAGCEPNTQMYNILLHACVEACQYDRAFRLFHGWKRGTLNETSGKDNAGSTDSILSTYKNNITSVARKVPFTPTTTTYNTLMKACGSDYIRAKGLMDEMKRVGLSPDYISWSILIDFCGGSGDVEGAIQILKNMRMDGIQPDVVAYTTAIKVCVENKSLQLAYSLFEQMKRLRIRPNLVTYNTLLRARSRYGSLNEVQECLAIYQDMRKAGYNSNDYYLKELIEEWCEGVIQSNNQRQGQFSPNIRTDKGRPQGLLLERVSAQLQKSISDSLAIDLQGLTQVEARIVVLAVLRMIKEKYSSGYPLKDDMLIILGTRKADANHLRHESDVKDAILKLLRSELGLEVLLARSTIAVLDQKPQLGREMFSIETVTSTRRPVVLERLKVTRKSLHLWLQRRVNATRR